VSPQFRTVALISAALGLLLSLFLVLRPGDDDEAAPTATVATTTAPATTATAPATTETEPPATTAPEPPDVITIRISVPGDTAPTVRRYSVKQGRQVELVVQSEIADEVHVHGYDLMADVAPGSPATIEFEATAPGRFEIELEEHKLPIAELEVRP
jgi:heme/copper-type cytochrome/quinol oxidase subunit 2